jgi:hypothetical protein
MPNDNPLLDRVRKLLAKAEAVGTTLAEAEALTAKAAELMARYGIDRALLAADNPDTDRPADRVITVTNPWARVQAHLLCGLAAPMRCQCVLLPPIGPGVRVHVFGFSSDIERAEVLFTSILVQMWRGLAATPVPAEVRSVRSWRRSWLLGFASAVVARVKTAEQHAADQATTPTAADGSRAALVLADRRQIIQRSLRDAYPKIRSSRMTYTGSGYGDGYAKGQQADLGGTRVPGARHRALGSGGS